MIDFGRPAHINMEHEVEHRGDTVLVEVTGLYLTEEYDPEGYFYPVGWIYEFKVFAYNDLVQNYEVDITDTLTHEENFMLQKLCDEWAADQAADEAERRADR